MWKLTSGWPLACQVRARISLWNVPGVTGINKQQTPRQVSQQWLRCRVGTTLLVPGLAAKPPTGISQEGSQLAADFEKGCYSLGTNKKSPGRVVYLVREVLFCMAQGCQLGVELFSSCRAEALESKSSRIGNLPFCSLALLSSPCPFLGSFLLPEQNQLSFLPVHRWCLRRSSSSFCSQLVGGLCQALCDLWLWGTQGRALQSCDPSGWILVSWAPGSHSLGLQGALQLYSSSFPLFHQHSTLTSAAPVPLDTHSEFWGVWSCLQRGLAKSGSWPNCHHWHEEQDFVQCRLQLVHLSPESPLASAWAEIPECWENLGLLCLHSSSSSSRAAAVAVIPSAVAVQFQTKSCPALCHLWFGSPVSGTEWKLLPKSFQNHAHKWVVAVCACWNSPSEKPFPFLSPKSCFITTVLEFCCLSSFDKGVCFLFFLSGEWFCKTQQIWDLAVGKLSG